MPFKCHVKDNFNPQWHGQHLPNCVNRWNSLSLGTKFGRNDRKMDGVILRVEERENGNRELHSSSVILATNAFSKSLDPDVSVRPGRGLVLLTKALDSQPWRGTFHAQQGYIYFRNVGADRLLLGGARHVDLSGETTAQFGVNSDIKAFLGKYMNRY